MKEEHLVKCDVCKEEFCLHAIMKEHGREQHEMEDCYMCDERFLKEGKMWVEEARGEIMRVWRVLGI